MLALPLRSSRSLRRSILLLLFLASVAGTVKAQNVPGVRIVDGGLEEGELGRIFEDLDEARIPSDLLVDQVAELIDPTAYDGTRQAPPATLANWRQLYHQLSRSGIGRGSSPHPRGGRTARELPPIEQVNQVAERHLALGRVPLAVMNLPFAKIAPEALDSGRLILQNGRLREGPARGASPYRVHRAFAVAAFDAHATTRSVRFIIPTDLNFSRGGPRANRFTVDFDDGRGELDVRSGEVVAVEYDQGGTKEITLTAQVGDQIFSATTTLAVSVASIPAPDGIWSNQRAARSYAGGRAGYSAYFFHGNGNAAPTRPVVFVEGFDPYYQDPANRRTWEDIYEILLQENFVTRLRALGYDVVIMKLDNATDYVQRNAFALEHLLKRLRAIMPAGEEAIVVGPSMGGVIGRYALAYMERHRIPHNVRLFASIDAPQQAANFPLGVQFFLEFNDGDSELAAQGKAAINTIAARQMLAYQYRSFPNEDPLRTQLMWELAEHGYPSTRKIAIANGSGAGQSQLGNERVGYRQMKPGDKIVEYRYRSWFIALDGDVWALPNMTPETQIFEGLKNVIGPHYRSQNVYVSGTLPYDNTPGGSRGTQQEIADSDPPYGDIRTAFPDHSWIPTVSALDLDTPVLSYNVTVDAAGLTQRSSAGKRSSTNFDAIFYPQQNEPHVFATEENVAFLLEEIDTQFRASRTIARGRTFNSGQVVVVGDGVKITFAGPVSMADGVRFSLGSGAALHFKDRVTASGTAAAPIRFERSGAAAWGHLDLQADGNLFEYVRFDGGTKTVEARSRDNTFRHCVFRNGWRGISSHYAVAGGRSSFRLEHSVIAGNSSVGVVAYHSDPTIEYTTIRDNAQAGVWVSDAFIRVFHRSVVTNNALTQSSRSGVEVMGGGYVGFLAPNLGRGYTRISGNRSHEVFVSSSAAGAILGYLGHGGYNAVFDANEGSTAATQMLLRSTHRETTYADEVYWGGYYPGAGDITGPVFLGRVLYQDPTSGTPTLDVPLLAARSGDAPALARFGTVPEAVQSTATPATVPAEEPHGSAEDSADSGHGDRRRRMAQLRRTLQGEPLSEDVSAMLRELFVLQHLDHKDLPGERAANRAVFAMWRAKLYGGETPREYGAPARASRQNGAETAALLEIRDALLEERFEEASRLIDGAQPLVEQAGNLRTLLLERIALLEHEGRFIEALAVLDEVTASAAEVDEPPELYAIVREALNEGLGGRDGDDDAASLQMLAAADVDADGALEGEAALADGFKLGTVHPNPFNPVTNVPFALDRPASVRIDVHDVLGRRVAELVDGPFDAGAHTARFDAGRLPSGVYLVRVQVRGAQRVPRVFTRKVFLMK